MRVRSRLVLGFCGLAMSVPAASPASAAPQDGQPPVPIGSAGVVPSAGGSPVIYLQQAPVMPQQPTGAMPPAMAAPSAAPAGEMAGHHHHGILGRRHCVECQRAHAKAADGVNVPPPPGYPGGLVLAPGETLVSGPVIISERVVMSGDPRSPGYAVVGGQEAAPGYAVVNGQAPGAEPTPIGTARGMTNAAPDPRMARTMPRPGAGPYDPAVMQSSVPPPPTPMPGPGHNRPHIISHVFGLPKVGKLHEERVGKRREQHAAIAYGDQGAKVNELPASVVYRQK